MSPPFCDPEAVHERDEDGRVVGIRYEYEQSRNPLAHHVAPLLERARVQLVVNGHSHLWNRFTAANQVTHYLEASMTGRTHGAHTRANGVPRHVPPPPWRQENYPPFDDPAGLEPIIRRRRRPRFDVQ